jgi:hypothetical protein
MSFQTGQVFQVGARPVVDGGEMAKQRSHAAGEAARLHGAAARPVWAPLEVVAVAVVGRCGVAAGGGVGARHPDGLHQLLHGVATAVVA